jgi:hypothetical protein
MNLNKIIESLSDTELGVIANEIKNGTPTNVIVNQLTSKGLSTNIKRQEVSNVVINELTNRLLRKNVEIGEKHKENSNLFNFFKVLFGFFSKN